MPIVAPAMEKVDGGLLTASELRFPALTSAVPETCDSEVLPVELLIEFLPASCGDSQKDTRFLDKGSPFPEIGKPLGL